MRNNVNSPCRSTASSAGRDRSRVFPTTKCAAASILVFLAAIPSIAVAQPTSTETPRPVAEPVASQAMGGEAFDDLILAIVREAKQTGNVKPEAQGLFFEQVPSYEQLVAEGFSQAIAAEDLTDESLANLETAIGKLFAPESDQRKVLLQLIEKVRKARQLVAAGDVDGLKQLEAESITRSQKAIVERYLAKITPADKIPEPEAAEPTNAVSPYEKLRSLARGEGGSPRERLAQFGTVLTQISDGLAEGDLEHAGWPFDELGVRKSIHALVGTNVTMQERLVELYEDHIMFLVKKDDGEALRTYYFAVLELRPDPNELNNKLRLRIAFKAVGDNARHFAIGRLDELKQSGSISLLDRFRLVLKGYYGTAQPIVVLTMVCLGAFAAFLKLFRWSGAVKDTHDKYKRAKAFEEENLRQTEDFVKEKQRASRPLNVGQGPRRFREPQEEKFDDRRGPGYFRPVDSEDEYSRLLAFFELEDDATEADIKAAYREMVKLHHPDRNPEGEKDEIEAFFQEIKQKYDRIMEMRGSWFGKAR